MVYQLKKEQFLPINIEHAWSFFSSPRNLAEITPDYMGFKITSLDSEEMYAGQIIRYKVKPIFNIPLNWTTKISHVDEPYYFVDEQLQGPYKLWHHQHIFKEVEKGVLMKDILTYEPPLMILGQIANTLFIKKQVQGIFDYREEYLAKKFNT